ncbi:MAG: TRAP transporter substrate-binding protein, partial [Propionivibrio sp.]
MKKLVISSLLAVSALSLTFPAAAQEAIKLKLGHVAPTDEPYHQAAEKFAELVKKNTGGAVEIQIFPNSLLGGQRELLEGLQLGSVDITLTTAAVLSSFLPKTQVIELPFMFRDSEHVYKVVDGPLAKEIYAGDEKKKMKVIDTWENGFRNITNNVRPIETPDDMKGVKIRVMENKMYIEM